eukprot:Nk52_evm11s263 gene=Nk52_evmTU11s263
MGKIKIYARLKPHFRPSSGIQPSHRDDGILTIVQPRDVRSDGYIDNQLLKHQFRFDHIFASSAPQEEIFDTAAVDIVRNFLDGYNGTIFAYGQTGSGKTYTVEGSARRYRDRGLIPRALSMIYSEIEKRKRDAEESEQQRVAAARRRRRLKRKKQNKGEEEGEEEEGDSELDESDSEDYDSDSEEEEVGGASNGLISKNVYTIHISYLEIYNDVGYDLLSSVNNNSNNHNPNNNGPVIELPKVTFMEDEEGNTHVRNLSVHLAASEHVARNLLFTGGANRVVTETPMNIRSSRSHCVFTIVLTVRTSGSSRIRRSKLHLVDLAGSERVYKSQIDGVILSEAKYINLSLHYLEQVIVALQQKQHGAAGYSSGHAGNGYNRSYRSHIPYRNSMLTMILRDSLGGNCLTAMIATLSMEDPNVLESISTARFAQRVALVGNKPVRNEVVDDKVVIKQLKRKMNRMKMDMELLRQGVGGGELIGAAGTELLSAKERQRLVRLMQQYVCGMKDDPFDQITSIAAYRECMQILKHLLVSGSTGGGVMAGTPLALESSPEHHHHATSHSRSQSMQRHHSKNHSGGSGPHKRATQSAMSHLGLGASVDRAQSGGDGGLENNPFYKKSNAVVTEGDEDEVHIGLPAEMATRRSVSSTGKYGKGSAGASDANENADGKDAPPSAANADKDAEKMGNAVRIHAWEKNMEEAKYLPEAVAQQLMAAKKQNGTSDPHIFIPAIPSLIPDNCSVVTDATAQANLREQANSSGTPDADPSAPVSAASSSLATGGVKSKKRRTPSPKPPVDSPSPVRSRVGSKSPDYESTPLSKGIAGAGGAQGSPSGTGMKRCDSAESIHRKLMEQQQESMWQEMHLRESQMRQRMKDFNEQLVGGSGSASSNGPGGIGKKSSSADGAGVFATSRSGSAASMASNGFVGGRSGKKGLKKKNTAGGTKSSSGSAKKQSGGRTSTSRRSSPSLKVSSSSSPSSTSTGERSGSARRREQLARLDVMERKLQEKEDATRQRLLKLKMDMMRNGESETSSSSGEESESGSESYDREVYPPTNTTSGVKTKPPLPSHNHRPHALKAPKTIAGPQSIHKPAVPTHSTVAKAAQQNAKAMPRTENRNQKTASKKDNTTADGDQVHVVHVISGPGQEQFYQAPTKQRFKPMLPAEKKRAALLAARAEMEARIKHAQQLVESPSPQLVFPSGEDDEDQNGLNVLEMGPSRSNTNSTVPEGRKHISFVDTSTPENVPKSVAPTNANPSTGGTNNEKNRNGRMLANTSSPVGTTRESSYMSAVQQQKDRVARIRAAVKAAVVIQRFWRNYRRFAPIRWEDYGHNKGTIAPGGGTSAVNSGYKARNNTNANYANMAERKQLLQGKAGKATGISLTDLGGHLKYNR